MKKFLAALTMAGMLTYCGMAFASPNSDLLAKEEKASVTVVEAFAGNGEYNSVAKYFTSERKKATNSLAFRKTRAEINKSFGKLKGFKLVALEKFKNNDRLTYLASYTKAPIVKVVMLFKIDGKDAKLVNYWFTQIKQQAKAQNMK